MRIGDASVAIDHEDGATVGDAPEPVRREHRVLGVREQREREAPMRLELLVRVDGLARDPPQGRVETFQQRQIVLVAAELLGADRCLVAGVEGQDDRVSPLRGQRVVAIVGARNGAGKGEVGREIADGGGSGHRGLLCGLSEEFFLGC